MDNDQLCSKETGFECPICKNRIYLVIAINPIKNFEDAYCKVFKSHDDAMKSIESLGTVKDGYKIFTINVE